MFSDDELQVPCEDPVFDSVLQWLTTETEVRKDVFEKIVEHVRLPYCSSAYLCHVVQQHDRMSSEMCKNLVKEARDFQLQPEHQLQVNTITVKFVHHSLKIGFRKVKIMASCPYGHCRWSAVEPRLVSHSVRWTPSFWWVALTTKITRTNTAGISLKMPQVNDVTFNT